MVGLSDGRVKPKILKLAFVALFALMSERRDGLARIQDNVSSWSICLPVDCCFSDLALAKSLRVDIVHNRHRHHHFIKRYLLLPL